MKRLFYIISFLLLVATSAYAGVTEEIDRVLNLIPYAGRHEFNVDVRNGVVTIDGFVSSTQDEKRVISALRNVSGVRQVINKLQIQERSAVSTAHEAKTIRDHIKSEEALRNYSLDIRQSVSTITLSGVVDSEADRELIHSIARKAAPAFSVQNDITVRATYLPSDSEITNRVLQALRSESIPNLENISIETRDGVVHFAGEARNQREADRILSIALMVDGVKSIRSDLKKAQ